MPARTKAKGFRRPGLAVVSRKGTAALYLRGTIAGRAIFESTGTDNPALAEEARVRREYDLQRHAIHGTRPEVTFAAAALSYLEQAPRPPATRTNVRKLLDHFGANTACRAVGQAEIDRAGRAICPGAGPQGVLRQVITPAKAILNHAARRGWCDAPRFERVKGGGKRTDWFTPAEAEAMIAAAAPHLAPVLVLLFCTGARVGEAIELDWRDVDLANGRAVFRATKNGDDRQVDISPRCVAALANLPGERTGRVLRRPDGQAYRSTVTESGSYGGQFERAWKTALSRAGIERALTPHHARHSFASWHYALHRDPFRLRQDGGWRTVAMVERYAKLVPEGLRVEIARFWGVVEKQERIVA